MINLNTQVKALEVVFTAIEERGRGRGAGTERRTTS